MFIPHTELDREAMLRRVGVRKMDDLFKDIPEKYRFPNLTIPDGLTEMQIAEMLQGISRLNTPAQEMLCFLGAGAYNHYSPAVVDSILRRGEFFTAYTPYQPEISQGTLQAIYEYQSLISSLMGMEVCNASHYDGATAVAEAVNMAYAIQRGKRTKVILSPALHPHYRETVRTYCQDSELKIVGDEMIDASPDVLLQTGPEALYGMIDENTALVVVQYPDFFGRIFDFTQLASACHASGALLAVSANPISLGLLKPPGAFGADIVTGEGQPLGIPLSFGGPYLGLFTTRKEHIRKMAGRLVGETVDNEGKRAFTLTLTAREQHIRREKATSNICSNQGIMTLAAAVYLSVLGKHGLKQVAELNYQKAHYAAKVINRLDDFELASDLPFFNEFVVACPYPVQDINDLLLEEGILGGYALGKDYPQMEDYMLVAVTETLTREQIDYFGDSLLDVQETLDEWTDEEWYDEEEDENGTPDL